MKSQNLRSNLFVAFVAAAITASFTLHVNAAPAAVYHQPVSDTTHPKMDKMGKMDKKMDKKMDGKMDKMDKKMDKMDKKMDGKKKDKMSDSKM